jgi:hypothetical protein
MLEDLERDEEILLRGREEPIGVCHEPDDDDDGILCRSYNFRMQLLRNL